MAQRIIRFRIRPDGRVESLTERIEARLGRVSQRRSTAESFAAQPQGVSQLQSLQQGQEP
jgi:hypothetical protein